MSDINYYKVINDKCPQLIDTTSSSTIVYLRKNITTEEYINNKTKETCIKYYYDEAMLSKNEYNEYINTILIDKLINIEDVLADILYGGENNE